MLESPQQFNTVHIMALITLCNAPSTVLPAVYRSDRQHNWKHMEQHHRLLLRVRRCYQNTAVGATEHCSGSNPHCSALPVWLQLKPGSVAVIYHRVSITSHAQLRPSLKPEQQPNASNPSLSATLLLAPQGNILQGDVIVEGRRRRVLRRNLHLEWLGVCGRWRKQSSGTCNVHRQAAWQVEYATMVTHGAGVAHTAKEPQHSN